MSYLDSPIGRCEAEHTMVLLDQTKEQCSAEHECPEGRICPLAGCFENVYESYRSTQAKAGSGSSHIVVADEFFRRMRGVDSLVAVND